MSVSICKWCGGRTTWIGRVIINADDGKRHNCKPNVKVYTDEEKRALQAKLDNQIPTEKTSEKTGVKN